VERLVLVVQNLVLGNVLIFVAQNDVEILVIEKDAISHVIRR
jgi:hypothetical protein